MTRYTALSFGLCALMAFALPVLAIDPTAPPQILNVPFANGQPPANPTGGAPANGGRPLAKPPVGSAETCRTPENAKAMAEALHPGGQKTALIVRAQDLGVDIGVVQFLKKLASALTGVKPLKDVIERLLAKTYISDEEASRKMLEEAGYKVNILTSADYAKSGKLDRFKTDILANLGDKSTSVFIFYGHGFPDGIMVVADRENRIPSPAEIKEILSGKKSTHEFISVDEIIAARAGNGLDAFISQACQNGVKSYLKERGDPPGGSYFTDALKPDGFFAGWVTYAIFLEPHTPEILDRFFCHMLKKAQNPGVAAKPGRYYLRSSHTQARKLGHINGMDDVQAIADLAKKVTLTDVDNDKDVVENSLGPEAQNEGFNAIIDLVHSVKKGKDPLAKDLATFMSAYATFCVKYNISIPLNGKDVASELATKPNEALINAVMASSGKELLSRLLGLAMPGQAFVNEAQLAIQPGSGVVSVSLDMDVKKGADVERVLKLVSDSQDPWITKQLADLPAGAPGLKPIGPELAARVGSTLDAIHNALPKNLASLRLKMTLEKIAKGNEQGIVPRVQGYNIAVGSVPDTIRNAESYPYQIHVSLAAQGEITKSIIEGLFGNEVEIKKNIDFGISDADVYAYVKTHTVGDLTSPDKDAVELPIQWQVRVNWGPLGDGFGYVDTGIQTKIGFKDELVLTFSPSTTFQLGDGFPRIGRNSLSTVIQGKLNAELSARARDYNIGEMIPESYRNEVVGKVKIAKLTIENGVGSIHFTPK